MRYLNLPVRETSAAFFDVDETLINVKSMFSFLEFYLRKRGEPEATYGRLSAELRHSAGLGVPRKDINRHYYRFYAGHSAQQLARAGREWFTAEQEKGVCSSPKRGHGSNATCSRASSWFCCPAPSSPAWSRSPNISAPIGPSAPDR